MKNRSFHFKLRALKDAAGKPMTIQKIADAIYTGRAHLTDVLNNRAGHGANTRPKVVKFLNERFPEKSAELLASLGWDSKGGILGSTESRPTGDQNVSHGTFSST
jgi:hypothetical protein